MYTMCVSELLNKSQAELECFLRTKVLERREREREKVCNFKIYTLHIIQVSKKNERVCKRSILFYDYTYMLPLIVHSITMEVHICMHSFISM